MSAKLVKAILDHDLAPSDSGRRFVLMVLACYANDDGTEARPGLTRLCRNTGLARRTVLRHLAELQKAGWIALDRHSAKKRASVWRVMRDPQHVPAAAPATGAEQVPVTTEQVPVTTEQVPVTTRTGATPSGATSHDSSKDSSESLARAPMPKMLMRGDQVPVPAPNGTKPVSPDEEAFGKFWENYPKKVARRAAAEAFAKALKSDGADVITAGLAAWRAYWSAAETDKQFIPYPAKWLNESRYLDVPDPPPRREPKGFSGTRDYLERHGGEGLL